MFGTVTTEDELYFNTIRTVHCMCVEKMGLCKMQSLLKLQQANGVIVSFAHSSTSGELGGGGLTDWLHAGAAVFRRHMCKQAKNSIMASLFPEGLVFGSLGAGSNDRSFLEQEASVLRFIGPDGIPFMAFDNLLLLDLETSVDGRSPDAQCITAAYTKAYEELQKKEGFLRHGDWKKALIGSSWDGASVMSGDKGGVAKKLKKDLVPHHISVHAAAHVEQLALADAFACITYYKE